MKFLFYLKFIFVSGIQLVFGQISSEALIKSIQKSNQELERRLTQQLATNPQSLELYSRRGDARMFLGNFAGARNDYERMILINSSTEVSHWRLGIAYYYLGLFGKAARQFEIYHQFDSVDRENGIWRFMSQFKSKGLKAARDGLLHYQKSDRPPYPLLYEMFAGRLEPEEVFLKIDQVDYPAKDRERVLFHACLYVGIYLELVQNNQFEAKKLLKKAFENQFGRATGNYMWQIARLHYFQLRQKSPEETEKKETD